MDQSKEIPLVEQYKNLEKKVDKILFYMESDPSTKAKGIVEKTADNSLRLFKLESRLSVFEAKASVLGFIGGAIVSLIVWVVKQL